MILSKTNVRIRPLAPRRKQCGRKKINCATLRGDSQRRNSQEVVGALLRGYLESENLTGEESWKKVSERLMEAATNLLGTESKEHID